MKVSFIGRLIGFLVMSLGTWACYEAGSVVMNSLSFNMKPEFFQTSYIIVATVTIMIYAACAISEFVQLFRVRRLHPVLC